LDEEKRESYVYEYFVVETNEIFYVGKGIGNRIDDTTNRNQEFTRMLKDLEGKVDKRKVRENLTDAEAGEYESYLIQKYREEGQPLTNIQPGGSSEPVPDDKIAEAKYLIFLIQNNLIKMSYEKIIEYTGCHTKIIMEIKENADYKGIIPQIPHYIEEVIARFHANNYTDEQKKVGHIKYLLELIDKKIIRMSQVQLGEYYRFSPTVISQIRKEHTHAKIPPISPDNLYEILKEYDVHTLSEREKTMGMLAFIVRLQEQGILKVTSKQIGDILGISSYMVTELRRNPDSKKGRTVNPEFMPTEDIMKKLTPYFVLK